MSHSTQAKDVEDSCVASMHSCTSPKLLLTSSVLPQHLNELKTPKKLLVYDLVYELELPCQQ
jgi:hypothetical protein